MWAAATLVRWQQTEADEMTLYDPSAWLEIPILGEHPTAIRREEGQP